MIRGVRVRSAVRMSECYRHSDNSDAMHPVRIRPFRTISDIRTSRAWTMVPAAYTAEFARARYGYSQRLEGRQRPRAAFPGKPARFPLADGGGSAGKG